MDLQAFKQHILPVHARLFRLTQMFLRNREEAEDATQNASQTSKVTNGNHQLKH